MGERKLSAYQERELITLLETNLLERARSEMLAFTTYTMPKYYVNWHHRLLCTYLDRLARGDIDRLMVYMPPRHGKSELVSRRFPAFLFGQNPDLQIITASYSDSLASEMNKDVQRIIDDSAYRELFPETKIGLIGNDGMRYSRNSGQFDIIGKRGKYKSAGIGTGITGLGADVFIIDDPVKDREEARSLAYRDRVWNWYDSVASTRLEKNAKVLVTMTRWNEDDLGGRLIDKMKSDPDADQWTILKLPMVKTIEEFDQDPREIGEPLWPWKYPPEKVKKMKANATPETWNSLFQQDPKSDEGGLFESRMFEFAAIPSEFDYMFATADTSYKDKEKNDFTAITVFGVKDGRLFVVASFMKRIKATEAEGIFKSFIKPWIKYNFRATLIEPKGHGIYLNTKLISEGIRIPGDSDINDFFKDRRLDKVERANNAIPHLSTKSVIINEAIPHRQDLVDQCLVFPNGAHDDFVDTLVDGIKFAYGAPMSLFDML